MWGGVKNKERMQSRTAALLPRRYTLDRSRQRSWKLEAKH